MNIDFRFTIGDNVLIDLDPSLTCTVIGCAVYSSRILILVSYMHNGDLKEQWIDEWRLTFK